MAQRGILTEDGYLFLETQPGWFSDGECEFELRNTDITDPVHEDIDAIASATRLVALREAIRLLIQ